MDKDLKTFLNDIRSLYRDARVYLFGSRARGDFHEDSDYDLIIISPKFRAIHFLDRGATIWRHSDVGIGADLLCYTPEEFKRISKTSVILRDAMKDAVAL